MANVPVDTKPFKKTNYPASHPNRGQSPEGGIQARREQAYRSYEDQVSSKPRSNSLPSTSVPKTNTAGMMAHVPNQVDMTQVGPYAVKKTPAWQSTYVGGQNGVGGQFGGMATPNFSKKEINAVYGKKPATSTTVTENNQNPVADTPSGGSSAAAGTSASAKGSLGKTALKVGGGLGLGLSALSKITDFAAKMGDVSRKMMQGALNPSPLGTNEFKNLANLAEGSTAAAQSGINSINELNTKRKTLRDNNRVADLEAIRSKYVDKLKNAPLDSDWGDIADEYMNEVNQYFADKKINPASIASNNIIAKQVNQTARELTNIAQRKKTAHNIELTDDVLNLRENANVARDAAKADRMQLRDINAESKKKFDNMWTNHVDVNKVPISNEDYETLDLLANDVGDVNTAGEWTVGQRFDTSTYRKLTEAAKQRMFKAQTKAEKDHWKEVYEKYQNQVDEDTINSDFLKYGVTDDVISDPTISLTEKLKRMNAGSKRGYDLNDIQTIKDIGFVPNKNLINDARLATRRTKKKLQIERDRMAAANPADPNLKKIDTQLAKCVYDEARLSNAFYLADVEANVFEKLERTQTVGGKKRKIPVYTRGKENDPLVKKWFREGKGEPPKFLYTNEHLKEAVYNEVYDQVKMANAKLLQEWKRLPADRKHEFKGLETALIDPKTGKKMIDKATGQEVTIGMELNNNLAKVTENYDLALGIMHKHGVRVPENMKELTKALGLTIQNTFGPSSASAAAGVPTGVPTGAGPVPAATPFAMPTSFSIMTTGGTPVSMAAASKYFGKGGLKGDNFFNQVETDFTDEFDRTKIVVAKWFEKAQNTKQFQDFIADPANSLDAAKVSEALKNFLQSPNGKVSAADRDLLISVFAEVGGYDAKHKGDRIKLVGANVAGKIGASRKHSNKVAPLGLKLMLSKIKTI